MKYFKRTLILLNLVVLIFMVGGIFAPVFARSGEIMPLVMFGTSITIFATAFIFNEQTAAYIQWLCKPLQEKDNRRRWFIRGQPSACVSSYRHEPVLGPELAMDECVEVVEVRKEKKNK